MASPAVTYTFANSTTADATQVNQNFTDLISGATDGTKDYAIAALSLSTTLSVTGAATLSSTLAVTGVSTFTGAASFSGNVTLGNASADDVTITGSIAASIGLKTTFSVDVGSSTVGLKSIYLGSVDSAARTTRLRAGTVATSNNISLPVYRDGIVSLLPTITTTQTTTYQALVTDEVIGVDGSGAAWTLTLYAASGNAGRRLRIYRTDQTLANVVTIDGSGAETINGAATIKLATQYESVVLECDGTNWFISSRYFPSVWTAYTPTFAWTANATATGFWKRLGDSIECWAKVALSGATTNATFTATIPSGLTIDTAKLANGGNTTREVVDAGGSVIHDAATGLPVCTAKYNSTTTVALYVIGTGYAAGIGSIDAWAASDVVTNTNIQTLAAGDSVTVHFKVPITNWEA